MTRWVRKSTAIWSVFLQELDKSRDCRNKIDCNKMTPGSTSPWGTVKWLSGYWSKVLDVWDDATGNETANRTQNCTKLVYLHQIHHRLIIRQIYYHFSQGKQSYDIPCCKFTATNYPEFQWKPVESHGQSLRAQTIDNAREMLGPIYKSTRTDAWVWFTNFAKFLSFRMIDTIFILAHLYKYMSYV